MRSAAGVPAAGPQEGSGKAGQGWRMNPEHSGDEKKITEALQEVLSRAGNKLCADCGAKHPRWASVNLGVFVCLECSGVHRKMGVHISKVKSATLDRWTWQWIETVRSIGNDTANAYYEYRLPKDYRKATRGDDNMAVENWIRMKYERKSFAPKGFPEPWQAVESGADPRVQCFPSEEGNASETSAEEAKKVKSKKEKKKKKENLSEADCSGMSPRASSPEQKEPQPSAADQRATAASAASLVALTDSFASLGVSDLANLSSGASNAFSSPFPASPFSSLGASSDFSGQGASPASEPAQGGDAQLWGNSDADRKVQAAKAAIAALYSTSGTSGLPASLGAGLGPFPAGTVGCGGPSSGTSPEWPENAPPTNPAAPWPGAWPAASQETVAHRGGGQALHATTLSSSFFPPAAPAAPSRNGVFFSSDASVSPSLGSAPVLGATRLETEQSRNGGVGAADSLAGGMKLGEVSLWNADVSSPPKKDVFSSLNSLDAFALAGKVQAKQKATPTAGVSTCCSGGTQLNGAKSDATFAGAGWLGVATPSPPAQAPGSSAEELLLI
ncbi:GTPase activating protein for Arf protein [Toxoplasma gondii ME49]|uniref:ARF1-directed GTPase-activating protein,putative n=4 Tax=Toxoplasma gondii TaxID=5811 RepID=A0A125YJF6_TOXGV|nr:GTPase activating protein for Arf protein [Toxoplasma gondii ME49]EPT26293.1 GTPase activating protein for Arf protein [Toxoplasma gondii ME49]ESS34754.1 GTPase activating protein for Arf protein [Toxoplasma gondii VEG]CEL77242.1 TPA: ARF1-directed GTPase-activating protein,putative [Toxoplasma gondii VEG]|eukprot:XP_018635622.1 GTPase activating protein for Arf protein [Toxoplasma gondii ME49]